MRHDIPVETLGAGAPSMAAAIEACVHCGFCLPTCPTYATMSEEMDSPRGRIVLMKEVLGGELELEAALPYVDNCLGCQACETACPSGVQYGDLITPFRAYAERHRKRPPMERARRAITLATLSSPRRFRAAATLGAIARPLASLLPGSLSAMLRLLPDRLPAAAPLPAVHPASGARRARVALVAGCAQQVLAPSINWAALRVLARNGVETVIPSDQGCCGALALHAGDSERAQRLARRNLAAFPDDVDAVIATAAGCGSSMHEYGLLFAGDRDHAAAARFADRVVDASVFLAELGLREPPRAARRLTIAYQDACHLAHAQGVRSAPRDLLAAIEGVTLCQPDEWELCCGSAGTYNVERPEVADALGRRKAQSLIATGADLIASGNIGCMIQMRTHMRALGHDIPILHTLEVLDQAYDGALGA